MALARFSLSLRLRLRAAPNLALALGLVSPLIAHAQGEPLDKQIRSISAQLKSQENRLAEQEKLLKAQQEALALQSATIAKQRNELRLENPNNHLAVSVSDTPPWPTGQRTDAKPTVWALPAPNVPFQLSQVDSAGRNSLSRPTSPVGEAPATELQPEVVQSLPEGLAVLTPPRHFILTPSIEYTHTNNDRLVFRGVVIVPGLNLGEVDASSDDRNIVSGVLDLRYGVFSGFELEARVPYTFSDDRASVLSQGPNGSATQSIYLHDWGIGDVEVGARYQINSGRDEWPIFVANARVKTDVGLGPFEVQRDAAGVAEQVALGSGFVGLSGGFSMLKLSDPVVLFASANYMYQIPKDINQTIGNVFVGKVEPGSSVTANLGFGFAVNPEFSFSLGYEHSYVFPQYTMLGTTQQKSNALQVGAMTLGMAYRLSSTTSLNANFEFGATKDAPDVRAVFSLPISF